MPGRHAAPAGPSFYRDLLTMLGGIVVVGIIVYLGLSALSTTDSPGSTATTVAQATTAPPLTTTTRATTTTSTATTTTASTTSTSTTVAIRDPSEVVVVVLNGVGVPGLAAEVGSRLEDLGYQMLEPGNYEPELSQSLILYSEGFEAEAFELAAEFPDAQVQQDTAGDENGADIVVVLGESYEG